MNDWDRDVQQAYCDKEDLALKKLRELGFPTSYDDEDYIEQRVFLKDFGSNTEDKMWKKSYDPYEQDLFNFPDSTLNYEASRSTARTSSTTSRPRQGSSPRTRSPSSSARNGSSLSPTTPGTINTISDLFINCCLL